MAVRSGALPLTLRSRHLRRPSRRSVVIAAVVAVAVAGGWMWLRDSSLVQVRDVQVTGVHGAGAGAVRSALTAAGQDMTTLNVNVGALRSAVARYSIVRSVRASADLPHGLKIVVDERAPVGAIQAAGMRVAVAEDGVLLRDMPTAGLPVIVNRMPPAGGRVADRKTAAKVEVLAAAPPALRRRVEKVTLGPFGLTATLTHGPVLRFGDGGRLHAKWDAARSVMLDPGAKDATYIDLRVPEKPAAGGLSALEGGAPQSLTASLQSADQIAAQDGTAPATQDGTGAVAQGPAVAGNATTAGTGVTPQPTP